jgi:ribosomal protein S18 acetylase RimI-like enzyme
MFAPHSLAARIERAEMRLSQAIAETVAGLRPDARVLMQPCAGGLGVYAGPTSPASKVIGLGFEADWDLQEIEAIERAWCERGEAVRVELSSRADAAIGPALTERGYRLAGFEDVLGLALAPETGSAATPSAPIAIEELGPGEWRPWMDAALEGFAVPDGSAPNEEHFPREVLENVFSDIAQTAGFRRYVARIDGTVAGAASLRLDDRVAQLCGAATLAPFRRRGVQAALLARRLADATAAGCDVAVVVTQPGSKSQANAVRQGFAVLYTRAILIQHRTGGPVAADAT